QDFPGDESGNNGDRDAWADVDSFIVNGHQFLIAASILDGGRTTIYGCDPLSAMVGSSFGLGDTRVCGGYSIGKIGYAFSVTWNDAGSGTGQAASLNRWIVEFEEIIEGA